MSRPEAADPKGSQSVYLSVAEAARITGIGRNAMYAHLKGYDSTHPDAGVEWCRLKPGGHIKVSRASLNAWLADPTPTGQLQRSA